MLYHANVRFVARHIPEAAPVGPELSLFLDGHRKLFTTFLPRVWIAVLEDQDQQRHLQFPGISLRPLGATAMRRIVPARSEKQGRIYPVVDACAGTPLLSALSS